MSSFTYFMFWALITGIGIGTMALVWWIRREINRVDHRIDMHDECADNTSKLMNQMTTDIAVMRESVENLETEMRAGMKDIKKSISDMNNTIIDKLTR